MSLSTKASFISLAAFCNKYIFTQEEKSTTVERYIEVIRNRTEILKQLTEELFRYSVIITTEDEVPYLPAENDVGQRGVYEVVY